MDESKQVLIGTDCGATMSKVGGVWGDGTTISTKLLQRPTGLREGPRGSRGGWVAGSANISSRTGSTWDQVSSVGLAIPGPYLRYGVLGRSANMPASFEGWDFDSAYSQRAGQRAGAPGAAGGRQ